MTEMFISVIERSFTICFLWTDIQTLRTFFVKYNLHALLKTLATQSDTVDLKTCILI